MEVTRVRMKKEEDKRGNKKGKKAGGEEHRGGREAAGIHGTLERDAGPGS